MNLELLKEYPILQKTTEYLQNKTFLMTKMCDRLFNDDFDFDLAERICKQGLDLNSNNWDRYYEKLDNLIDLSLEFLTLQAKLEKTGKYLYSTFDEVEKNEYNTNNNDPDGPDYLWGMYFSEIFWEVHNNYLNFSLKNFMSNLPTSGKVLEVPCGTGFFLHEFLRKNPNWFGTGVDLADASIKFSQTLFQINNVSKNSYKILKKNFHHLEPDEKYDRILCGEFMEHLEDPFAALKRLNSLLLDNGKMFITVAVWAANIDHIYVYTKPQEVRDHIEKAGFKIENELVQTVFEKDVDKLEIGKVPIGYAAILTKN